MHRHGPLPPALGTALALLLATAAQAQEPRVPRFSFSEGPLERAWALVEPDGAFLPLEPQRLPGNTGPALESAETWQRWAESVRAASAADGAPAARLWLAAFAVAQERWDDAWEHLAHAAEDQAGLRATLPLLLPGVEPQVLSSWPTLPDGALLAPALPPPDRPVDEILLGTGRLRRGSARVEGFRVGAALLSLSLKVEGDGVQVDLEHLGGGPARVRVRLPEPPDFELRSEYLDWGRLERVREERVIDLEPGGETRTLFGRYQPRRLDWPATAPRQLGQRLQRRGLRILTAPPGVQAGLAQGLGELLGVPVETATLPPGAVPGPFDGVVVDLRAPATLGAKRAALVGLAERFVLSAPR
jgi:hypothetical protein